MYSGDLYFIINNYCISLRGHCTPNQKLAFFVLYLKIINSFLEKKIIYAFYSKLSKEPKNGIKIEKAEWFLSY